MKKGKGLLLVSLIMLICCVLSACGGEESSGASSSSTDSSNEPLKVALILPGKIDDVSFNQAMYEGMREVKKELGDQIEFAYTEEVYEVSDIEPALRDYASEGYDLVIGHGFQFMEPIIKVAQEFPDTMFALGTGYKTVSNSCVYDVQLQDGGYLMGTLAAMVTKTNKIGVVGGSDVSEIYRGHEAFKYAAKQVNPDVEIQELYTGDWNDVAKAKEGAISMYDSGVDIIWHSGDGIGLGVVQAAKEKDKICLGNVSDQNVLAPDNVLSGVVYDWAPIIKQMINDIQTNNFTNRDDKYYWITVGNGGIQVAPFRGKYAEYVTDEVKAKLEEVQKGLADGTIAMPDFEQ